MPTLYQGYVLMAMLYAGIIAGIVYEAKNVISITSEKIKIVGFLLDFLYSMIFVAIFFYANLFANCGIIRLFPVLAYILGFFAERKTIGFIVAKIFIMLYNLFVKVVLKIKNFIIKVSTTLSKKKKEKPLENKL